MPHIRSRGNKDTELALIRVFRAHRITGWRRHQIIRIRSVASVCDRRRSRSKATGARRAPLQRRSVPTFQVKPDFVFPKLKLAVFVDGCFWHSCPKHATKPKNNAAFWRKKLASNQTRDRLVNRTLRHHGWRVLRIWECDLANEVRLNNEEGKSGRLVRRIQKALDTKATN